MLATRFNGARNIKHMVAAHTTRSVRNPSPNRDNLPA